ncbi:hypothetical protein FH972_023244 [Carpinus fangiana]|uniref:Mpv17/PMP22 family protein n=1 Tax=Carpinus fangiana TaxID=176857 RepID=A0A5N6KUN1_9ROSI|nr:hypothetical protein FH972_023244 [Carpinus fangiana]
MAFHSQSLHIGATLRSGLRPHLTRPFQPRGNNVRQVRQQASSTKPSPAAKDLKPQPTQSQSNAAPPAPAAAVPESSSFIPIPFPGQRFYTTALQPIAAPFRAYGRVQQRHPRRTQILTALAIYFIGDLSTQFVLRPQDTPATDDPSAEELAKRGTIATFFADTYSSGRSLRALVVGGIFALPSYYWFIVLGRSFNVGAPVPRKARFAVSLAFKVCITQLLYTPVFNTYFFGLHSLLAFPVAAAPGASAEAEDAGQAVQRYASRFFSADNGRAAWERVSETVPISWWNSCKFWPPVTAFTLTFVAPQHRSVFAGCVAVVWQTYLGMVNQRAAVAELERARLAAAGA